MPNRACPVCKGYSKLEGEPPCFRCLSTGIVVYDTDLTLEQASHLIPAEPEDSEHEWVIVWGNTLSIHGLCLWHKTEWCSAKAMMMVQTVESYKGEPGWMITKAYSAVPTMPCAGCDTPVLFDYLCEECRG